MSQIRAMSFDLVMDRVINEEVHYIVPGGYEVGGRGFDFETTNGMEISGEDPKVLHFEGWDVCDVGDGPIPSKEDVLSGKWGGFYVFTGEADEPAIYAEEVKNLVVEFDDGSNFLVTGSALSLINDLVKEDARDQMEARREMEEKDQEISIDD